ncbi:hypothetical protein [Mesorhizobium sp. M7A.F.Ca.CA.002.04.1.1]|uniref:hypothetical protein n=1 Tax=Mesorhizobium sp. M7A.F.Ca.CA.002.04.1.1 TaxID=2496681 RepID=UPI0019D418EA|nr:hypothetical protein [Mesorhizobium sp. M7A.F.Ca.CA.002.04.1.1]
MLTRDDFGEPPGENREDAGDPECLAWKQGGEDKEEAGAEQNGSHGDEQIVAAADQPQVFLVTLVTLIIGAPGLGGESDRAFHGLQLIAQGLRDQTFRDCLVEGFGADQLGSCVASRAIIRAGPYSDVLVSKATKPAFS